MMTESEFIQKAMATPWVNRGDTFEGMDCYGLFKLFCEKVIGKKLQPITGYKKNYGFVSLWKKYIDKHWRQVGRYEKHTMVTFYDYDDRPVHIGVCIGDNKVLHARGNEQKGGKVELHSIFDLLKVYKRATYHKVI